MERHINKKVNIRTKQNKQQQKKQKTPRGNTGCFLL